MQRSNSQNGESYCNRRKEEEYNRQEEYNRPQEKYNRQQEYERQQQQHSRPQDYNRPRRSEKYEKKEKVVVQPMRYKLTKLTQAQTLSQIAFKTSGFYDLSVNEADWIQRDVRDREFSSFGSLSAPSNSYLLNLITGNDNYYLKLTSKNHAVDFIYHDQEENEFHFWGEYQRCIHAMNEIRYRIQKITDREQAKREEAIREAEEDEKRYDEEHEEQYPYSVSNEEVKERTIEEQYGKSATAVMNKMGFVSGSGLGAKNSGRLEPINAISELGGRTHNRHFGLGFTGFSDLAKEPANEVAIEVANELANEVANEVANEIANEHVKETSLPTIDEDDINLACEISLMRSMSIA
jgi:hypothetical protein